MTNKEIAVTFLKSVVAGKIDEACEKFVDMKGKHHNLFFPAGFPALRQAMKDNQEQFPGKSFTVKNALQDGSFVVTHSHLIMNAEDKTGKIAVHFFRFENGKIIEMWDVGMSIPENSPNQDGPF